MPPPAPYPHLGVEDYLASEDGGEVQIFRRQEEWAPEIHQAGQVRLDCLGFELPLDVIYEDVTGL